MPSQNRTRPELCPGQPGQGTAPPRTASGLIIGLTLIAALGSLLALVILELAISA